MKDRVKEWAGPWVLFISPAESPTHEWQALELPSEAAVDEAAARRDLTKEWWAAPLEWLRGRGLAGLPPAEVASRLRKEAEAMDAG